MVQNIEKTSDEKKAVELELQNMLQQYEDLKTNNSQINEELEAEQEKIKKLIKQLKYVKSSNSQKIKLLEKETETLKNIMKSYIVQIDSLNTRNKILIAENKKVKKNYDNVVDEKEEIITQRDSLTGKIKKASVLKTYSISATALNKRDKTTTRARKTDKFQICFTLGQNVITRKGTKNIQIRIAAPDGLILMNSGSGMFMYGGKEIAYSSVRKIDYSGEDVNICIYWKAEVEQAPGRYEINIFADGYDVGQTSLLLK